MECWRLLGFLSRWCDPYGTGVLLCWCGECVGDKCWGWVALAISEAVNNGWCLLVGRRRGMSNDVVGASGRVLEFLESRLRVLMFFFTDIILWKSTVGANMMLRDSWFSNSSSFSSSLIPIFFLCPLSSHTVLIYNYLLDNRLFGLWTSWNILYCDDIRKKYNKIIKDIIAVRIYL